LILLIRRSIMPKSSWIKSSLLTGTLGVALAISAGAATPDAWITTKHTLAPLTTEGVSGTAITVDTRAGGVMPFGSMPSQQTRAAVADAHKMGGVQRVENAGEVVDEELARVVNKAFNTPNFKDITVEVRNGVVHLTGTVPSWAWRLEAVAVARTIPGVRAVEDDLHVMFAV
jgi:osmotically-inducible protein OsmY